MLSKIPPKPEVNIQTTYLFHFLVSLVVVFCLTVLGGCGGEKTTIDQPTETEIGITPSLTPWSATLPPTEMPTTTPVPAYEPPSVEEVLARLEGLPIDAFFEEAYRQLRLREGDSLFANGYGDVFGVAVDDQFANLSIAYREDTQTLEREILDLLHGYDRDQLSYDQQISYDALAWYLETHVNGQNFADYRFLVNPVWGLQNFPIDFLLEFPLENKQDAQIYIARLANLDRWAEQVVERLEACEKAGAIPPQYIIDNTIDQLDSILQVPGAARQEVYINFRSKILQIDELSTEDQELLLAAALQAVEEGFIPAYQELKKSMEQLSPLAVEDPNQWQLPGGEEYFKYLMQYHTGTDLSADEIHDLALAEVARLQEELREAAIEAGYPEDITIAEINQRISDEYPMLTGSELREKYEQILTAVDQAAEDYFGLRTSADIIIESVREGPPAYYQNPAPGSSDPGVMPVNLGMSPLWFRYNEYVLVHHETIPGHHTQITLAQELDLPPFQRYYSVNPYLQDYDFLAYTEGWAFYGEILAWEMGMYEGETLANLGRIRLNLFRTVRAVVDTGIHAKGWTLDEAADYLEEMTGMPQSQDMLTRYLVNPGYTCSYTVGKLKLLEMRQRAQEELGDLFDIKEFHNIVLGNGVLPISVMENVVEEWIEAKLNQPG
jgi:uncharacterized protein (DUF885 family)